MNADLCSYIVNICSRQNKDIIFRQPSAFTCNNSISLLSHNTTLFLEKSILVFIHESRDFMLKDKDYCPIEIIKGLTDKGQFQYLTKLMGPQEGTYLYATQFHSLR